MIILDRNVTVPQGAFKAGQDVSDLPQEVIEDLLRQGLAHEPTEATLEGVVDSQNGFTSLEELEREQLESMAVDMEIEGFDEMDNEALIAAIRAEEVELPALEEMEPEDLKALAKELKIQGFGNMKRETLIEKIREAEDKEGDGA